MKDCYWGMYNDGNCDCEHLACNGHCYKEEDYIVDGYKKKAKCFWDCPRTSTEVEQYKKKLDAQRIDNLKRRLAKKSETYWIRISFGLVQCSTCCWDFPGSVLDRKKCPHCGSTINKRSLI